jgi:hypothetical protein
MLTTLNPVFPYKVTSSGPFIISRSRHFSTSGLCEQLPQDATQAVMVTIQNPRSGGAAGSEFIEATDKSVTEQLGVALLGNIRKNGDTP